MRVFLLGLILLGGCGRGPSGADMPGCASSRAPTAQDVADCAVERAERQERRDR